jgi:HlyD family secretion protein
MKKTGIFIVILLMLQFLGCGNGNSKNIIEASGDIEATDVVVSAKVGGQIEKLNFIEGDKVKMGDTLLVLDSEASRIQLEGTIAARQLAEAQLQLLRNGARKEDIKQAEAALNSAKANYELAKNDKERYDKLYETKTVSETQHENYVNRYLVSLQHYNAAKENYEKMNHFARPEEIKQADARLNQTIANEDLIKKNIRDSYVTAPVSGFVVEKYFEAGETVSPLSSLLKLSDLSVVKLKIYVSEEELGRVKLGQNADVKVDAYKSKTFEGNVIYISPEAEFTPKNIQTQDERTKLVFAVKIEIKNPDFDLKPGMPADAVVHID